MPTTTTPDGVTIAFRHHGGDGPNLLLAHANGFCGPAWRPVAAILADRFSVWSLDLRGHGDSSSPSDGRFDWSGMGVDVLAVLDAVGGDHPWRGAGHSLGGAALLLAEQRRPGAFSALWLYEPIVMPSFFASSSDTGNVLAERALRRRAGFASRAEARDNYRSKPPMSTFHPEALEGYLEGGLHDRPDGTVVLACRPEVEAQVFSMGARHQAWEHLGATSCPTTVVAGSTDHPGPSAFAALIAQHLGHGRVESHPTLGHFAPFEHPDLIAGSIRSALDPEPPLSVPTSTIRS